MTQVSYSYQGVRRSYTPIAMDKLDVVRLITRARLKELSASTGKEYILRTFYLGPRKKYNRNTTKTDGLFAKIGIYKVEKRGKTVYEDGYVRRYVWSDLVTYV